jgi:hypothetical protein
LVPKVTASQDAKPDLKAVQQAANSVADKNVRVILSLLKEIDLVSELRGSFVSCVLAQKELDELARLSEEKGC